MYSSSDFMIFGMTFKKLLNIWETDCTSIKKLMNFEFVPLYQASDNVMAY